MNENQYNLVRKKCDTILESHLVTARVANTWLNILRGHPFLMKQYEFLFKDTKLNETSLRNYFLRLKYFLHWCIQVLFGFLSIKNSVIKKKFPAEFENIDFVFISHFVNKSNLKLDDDFYYGSLPANLKSQGFKVLVIYLNHTNNNSKYLQELNSKSYPTIFLDKKNRFFSELYIHSLLVKESKILGRFTSKSMFDRKMYSRASVESLSPASHDSLRLSFQFEELFKILKPKNVITTYEGHPWERLVFYISRKIRKDTFCLGYQHAISFKLHHGIRLLGDSSFNPDMILTSGIVGLRYFVENLSTNYPIRVLGSKNYLNKTSIKNYKYLCSPENVCLILPEGLPSECKILFDFSLKAAIMNPDITFIWRFHPILSYRKLCFLYPKFFLLPPNVLISVNSLKEDSLKAKWILYRGSTSIVSAVMYGGLPIYLDNKDLIIDPLFQAGKERKIVTHLMHFNKILVDKIVNSQKEKNKLINYCSNLFMPLDYKSLFR